MHHMSIISGNPDGYHTFVGEIDADAIGIDGGRIVLDGESDFDPTDPEDVEIIGFEQGMGSRIEPKSMWNCSRSNEGSEDPMRTLFKE